MTVNGFDILHKFNYRKMQMLHIYIDDFCQKTITMETAMQLNINISVKLIS